MSWLDSISQLLFDHLSIEYLTSNLDQRLSCNLKHNLYFSNEHLSYLFIEINYSSSGINYLNKIDLSPIDDFSAYDPLLL